MLIININYYILKYGSNFSKANASSLNNKINSLSEIPKEVTIGIDIKEYLKPKL